MAYSGKYKPVKGVGKPKTVKEGVLAERRVRRKYPDQKAKHVAAIKAAGESGLTKLARKIRKRLKGKGVT